MGQGRYESYASYLYSPETSGNIRGCSGLLIGFLQVLFPSATFLLAWAFFGSHETSQIHTVLVFVDSLETNDDTDTNTRLIQNCHLELLISTRLSLNGV